MKRKYILLVLFMLALTFTVNAQKKNYLTINNETAMVYFSGGTAKDGVLTLCATEAYAALSVDEKRKALECFGQSFPNHQIEVVVNESKKELWIPQNGSFSLIDTWDVNSNNIVTMAEDTKHIITQRRHASKWFLQVGGNFSGSKGAHNGTFSASAGTFLLFDRLDASVSLSMGYSLSNKKAQFTGSTGLDSRCYFPIRKINLAPYAGAGISWTFAPEKFFEARFLAGASWFVGPGSLDAGAQYGIKSGFSFTMGYTFHFRLKKKSR